MNDTTAGAPWVQPAPDVAHSWASAMTSPSADSPTGLAGTVREIADEADPQDAVLGRGRDGPVAIDERGDVGRLGLHISTHDHVVDGGAQDLLGRAAEGQVDVRDQSADRRGAGHHDPGAGEVRAVDGPVGMAGDDQVDLRIEPGHDVGDGRAADAGAGVDRVGRDARGTAALVQQHDDRLDALGLEDGHQRVDRIGLIVEVDVGGGGRASRCRGCPRGSYPRRRRPRPGTRGWRTAGRWSRPSPCR